MVKITQYAAPAVRAVTIPEFKSWARIDTTDEDDTVIPKLLDDAIAATESFTWRKLITQTWDEYFDDFSDPLYLRYGGVSAISSVKYTNSSQVLTTIETTIYELGEVHGRSVVRTKYSQTWPSPIDHSDSVVVRYVCGYGSENTDVPASIREAICIYAAWAYRNREGDILPFPQTFKRLLRPFSLRGWATIGAA